MTKTAEQRRKTRLDAEVGTIRKPWQDRIRVALVYPNLYGVGMASLGFQTAYRLLNAMAHVVCERAFLPDPEDENAPLVSLESGRRLRDFHCLAFSLSFELDYANVLTILQKTELPLPTAQRNISLPLVMAGGVSVLLNPEPLAQFFDLFLIGEGENLIEPFFNRFDPYQDRKQFLLTAAKDLPGVYVPAFYTVGYKADGALTNFHPLKNVPATVKRVYARRIDRFATDSVVVAPHASFEDAHLIEVSRGCPHGCRFCAAGYVYRPPRFRPLHQLQRSLETAGRLSKKIGLLGAAVSDLPHLETLCRAGSQNALQLSFSSLRADALTPGLVAALKSGRLKTATIAPEAGSERLRRVINKGLNETAILDAAELLVANGIPNLKLYFMIGLPTETQEDVAALADLVQKIKQRFLGASRVRGRMGRITISLNCFVPKPWTPFQWTVMDRVPTLNQKIRQIKKNLRPVANVRVQADSPRNAMIQAILSRGDRKTSDLLTLAHRHHGNWPQSLKQASINPAFYTHRERPREELLPWAFIDHGLAPAYLWNEYQRAIHGKTTPRCPADPENCRICGVCDGIAP
ncbi:MAG: radical SAM protein [Desulfatitalea sp.]|nr:radical SAM protein [Desulfatitalea sp.]